MALSDDDKIKAMVSQLTTQEKIDMVSGDTAFYQGTAQMVAPYGYGSKHWTAAKNERLGLEGVKFVDGPRGIIMKTGTTFPAAMARGATFNTKLEEQVGDAIGKELRAVGGNCFGGVCVNLVRHAAWGRAQESFGEDTLLLSVMGAATTRGVEKYGMAVVKHFALNSMENARFRVNVKVDERTLHEVYLRHFKRIVQETDCSFVMSAYNQLNGDYCGEHQYLLNEVLKKRWGFRNAVMTDFCFGLRSAKKSLASGQDLEMPFRQTFAAYLPKVMETGQVPLERLDDAVSRLIRVQLKSRSAVPSFHKDDHKKLALQVARESIVLLKNEKQILPLASSSSKTIALFGQLADMANTGDRGSSNTQPEHVCTPLEGLQKEFGERLHYVSGNDVAKVSSAAKTADACIVVVGFTYKDEGEFVVPNLDPREAALLPRPSIWDIPYLLKLAYFKIREWLPGGDSASMMGRGGDRKRLELSAEDEALIRLVASKNDNVIVVVMCGSAFICEKWHNLVKGIVCLWYPGEEGGTALADIVTGKINPSGKLPMTFAKSLDQLPFFDRDAEEIEYGFFHGYRKFDKEALEPAFPFGFGLSYTTFKLSNASVKNAEELVVEDQNLTMIELSLDVTNTGDKAGDEVVQIYASAIDSKLELRAPKELIGFQKIQSIQPGETRKIELEIPAERLAYYDCTKKDFVVEDCEYQIMFALSSRDPLAITEKLRVLVKPSASKSNL